MSVLHRGIFFCAVLGEKGVNERTGGSVQLHATRLRMMTKPVMAAERRQNRQLERNGALGRVSELARESVSFFPTAVARVWLR